MNDEMRRCVKCATVKPLHEFRRNYRILSGYDVKCKTCATKDEIAWREKTKAKK